SLARDHNVGRWPCVSPATEGASVPSVQEGDWMGGAAPWRVKGIDPRAREVAKELARRSGMTLGEWLNRIILEDDTPEEIASEEQITARLPRAFYEPPTPLMPIPSATPKPDERRSDDPRSSGDLGRIAQA